MRTQRTSVRFRTYRTARRALTAAYPAAFPARGRRPPLKVGILRDLLSADTRGLTATQVRTFLQVWTSSCSYLGSVARGGPRISLDGAQAGAVLAGNAEEAAGRIAERQRIRGKP